MTGGIASDAASLPNPRPFQCSRQHKSWSRAFLSQGEWHLSTYNEETINSLAKGYVQNASNDIHDWYMHVQTFVPIDPKQYLACNRCGAHFHTSTNNNGAQCPHCLAGSLKTRIYWFCIFHSVYRFECFYINNELLYYALHNTPRGYADAFKPSQCLKHVIQITCFYNLAIVVIGSCLWICALTLLANIWDEE